MENLPAGDGGVGGLQLPGLLFQPKLAGISWWEAAPCWVNLSTLPPPQFPHPSEIWAQAWLIVLSFGISCRWRWEIPVPALFHQWCPDNQPWVTDSRRGTDAGSKPHGVQPWDPSESQEPWSSEKPGVFSFFFKTETNIYLSPDDPLVSQFLTHSRTQ